VAFPTTPLLDDFNRANANLTSPWGGYPLGTGATLMRVLANQLDGGNGNTFDGSYWSTTQFGPDTEVVVTIATDDAANNELIFLLARLTSPNTASYNGYGVNVNRSGGLVEFYKLTAGAQSLKTSVSTTFASGDKVGLEVVNSGADVIVRAYKFTGGSWSLLGSWTDVAPTSTFTGQGNIGFECRTGVTPKFDDWSGGTVIATSAGWVRPVRIPNPRVGPDGTAPPDEECRLPGTDDGRRHGGLNGSRGCCRGTTGGRRGRFRACQRGAVRRHDSGATY
jgi:hypothetical protein